MNVNTTASKHRQLFSLDKFPAPIFQMNFIIDKLINTILYNNNMRYII